jgi:hypothetical protein
MSMVDRSTYPTRKLTLGEPEPDDVAALEPAERLAMVWTLTVQAWAFKGHEDESGLPRHVVRVVRRTG